MYLSLQALVLAALTLEGTLAQPSHRHQHKHRRDLADVLDKRQGWQSVDYSKLDWAAICANGACDANGNPTGNAAAPPAASAAGPVAAPEKLAVPKKLAVNPVAAAPSAASTSAAAPSTPSSTGSSGSSSGGSTGSCSDLKSVWDKTLKDTSSQAVNGSSCPGGCTAADGEEFYSTPGASTASNLDKTDEYIGNHGIIYGHVMFPVKNCDTTGYERTLSITNTDSEKIEVVIWLKNGDDGQPQSGMMRNAFWKFPLEVGQTGMFAVDANVQLALSKACGRIPWPQKGFGTMGCAWGEADFSNANNHGWSGYDRSTISSGQNIGDLSVCGDGHGCSTREANSFTYEGQLTAGGDLSIPSTPAHVRVSIGSSK